MPDVIVIGDGPGGLSAALFLAKNGKDVVVLGQDKTAMHYALLRNYLGLPEILGSEFQRVARQQVVDLGARLRDERVEDVAPGDGGWTVTLEGGEQLTARYLVLSEGKGPRLAKQLGLTFDEQSGIATDRNARSSSDGVAIEAERLARERSEFLANMSHEIRTPLNAVIGLSRAGVRDNFGRRAMETFQRILDSGQLLLGVVDDVLDYAKLQAGKVEIEHVPYALGDAIDKAVDLLAAQAYAKQLDLIVDEAPNLPATCLGDALRVSQILTNVLSNAVKYGAGKPIRVSVEASDDSVRLSVEDRGIGIPEEDLGRVFERYQRAASARHYSGLGLGLFIARQIVEAHGGLIGVRSVRGQGTVFSVELPRDAKARSLDLVSAGSVVHDRRAPGYDPLQKLLEVFADVATIASEKPDRSGLPVEERLHHRIVDGTCALSATRGELDQPEADAALVAEVTCSAPGFEPVRLPVTLDGAAPHILAPEGEQTFATPPGFDVVTGPLR